MMKTMICAKVSAWYAVLIATLVGCSTSFISCRAIIEGATDGVRVVIKDTIFATCMAASVLLISGTFAAMRSDKNPFPYVLAMSLVIMVVLFVKFFFVV